MLICLTWSKVVIDCRRKKKSILKLCCIDEQNVHYTVTGTFCTSVSFIKALHTVSPTMFSPDKTDNGYKLRNQESSQQRRLSPCMSGWVLQRSLGMFAVWNIDSALRFRAGGRQITPRYSVSLSGGYGETSFPYISHPSRKRKKATECGKRRLHSLKNDWNCMPCMMACRLLSRHSSAVNRRTHFQPHRLYPGIRRPVPVWADLFTRDHQSLEHRLIRRRVNVRFHRNVKGHIYTWQTRSKTTAVLKH